jgi:hypothetical protein
MALRKKSPPRWKQFLALGCVLYWLLAWVLPTLLLPFVNVLPFVHHADFPKRLLVSTAGTVLSLCIMYWLVPKRTTTSLRFANFTKWEKRKESLVLILGLALFTYMGAWVSANSIGTLARAFPSVPYHEQVVIENVTYEGSKYKSVSLVVRNQKNCELRYLTLSKRLFEYPRFKSGDTLTLIGWETLLGSYVTEFEFATSAQMESCK